MKTVNFVPLLALALGSFSAYAADSGTHTVNLTVSAPVPTVSMESALFSEPSQINIEFVELYTRLWGLPAPSYLDLGSIAVRASGLNNTNLINLLITSDNSWHLVKTTTPTGSTGNPIKYGLSIPHGTLFPRWGYTGITQLHQGASTIAVNVGGLSELEFTHVIRLHTQLLEYKPESGTYRDTIRLTISVV